MQPAPSNPSAAGRSPLVWLRNLSIGLTVAFAGLVLLIGMEGVINVNAHLFNTSPDKDTRYLVYLGVRGVAYLLLSGVLAWAIHWLASPQRRRRYWIALAIGTAFFISPAGVSAIVYGAMLVMYLVVIRPF